MFFISYASFVLVYYDNAVFSRRVPDKSRNWSECGGKQLRYVFNVNVIFFGGGSRIYRLV